MRIQMKIKVQMVISKLVRMFSNAFEGMPADFPSSLTKAQVLAQLQGLAKWRAGKLDIVGSVGSEAVELRISHTFRRNNGTRFQGHLQVDGEQLSLVGVFQSSAYSRFSTGAALGFLGLVLCGGLIGGLHTVFTHASNLSQALELIVFLLFWMTLGGLFEWLLVWNASPARDDVLALTAAIREALHGDREDSSNVSNGRF
ncbi:hypothetical protein GN109_16690 [Collimonas pratensis]|uniref:hypothetical protein n=1 Tax=Collimonas pratensis TaxID=279113 RepID=UPI00143CC761|nr:hypothetical protein [Collimonas pratensis]NKI71065.1 hypothetical protein [Collimonas pratensis]